MKIECYSDAAAFERLRDEWDELLHHAVTDSIFLTADFQKTWWHHFGSGQLCIIAAREENGELVGIMPLFVAAPRTLALVGCVDVADYLDIIVRKSDASSSLSTDSLVITGRETAVYAALLDTLMGPAFPHWDRIQLCTLPSSSPTNSVLKRLAEERGLKTTRQLHDVAPLIELPSTWDEYLERVDKKQRHEIRRKLRRMEEAGGRWEAVRSGQDLGRAVVDFVELHKKSQPDKHLFMDERMQGFFSDLALALGRHGWVQLEFLEFGGERAAALYNLIYNNRVLVYNSGYDPARYASYSPGTSLFAASIRQAIAAQRTVFDFMRGAEEYKYRFGAKRTEVYELILERA